MTSDTWRYFVRLCKRADSASYTPVEVIAVSHGEWEPTATNCHANINRWVGLAANRKAVRGWLINGTDMAGGYTFAAHSAVEEDGKLYDITPADSFIDVRPQRELIRRFLRHEGPEEIFFDMLPACNSVTFNPHF